MSPIPPKNGPGSRLRLGSDDFKGRIATKPCSKCGKTTTMGLEGNIPEHARDVWDGGAYTRFCGPKCQDK